MRQILHVFRKDLRHFWPESLAVLGLSLAFALTYPHTWGFFSSYDDDAAGFHLNFRQWGMLANTVIVLLPVAWLVLVARVIHDENLVGARQFWITRPYR